MGMYSAKSRMWETLKTDGSVSLQRNYKKQSVTRDQKWLKTKCNAKIKKIEKRKQTLKISLSTECNLWSLSWHRPEKVCKTIFVNTREL